MASTPLFSNLCKSFFFLLPLVVDADLRRHLQERNTPPSYVELSLPPPTGMNVIDRCWRSDPKWAANREALALCSVGFAGKLTENLGARTYVVTDSGDDVESPRPGTLRYGARFSGKVWITFADDMQIALQGPLMVKSFTTIDGRGADIHIAHGAGFVLHEVRSVIIHGLRFHHIRAPPPGGEAKAAGEDGDAIRLVSAAKVWIDHNTLSASYDGLIDVTLGSTGVTVSNNWFRDHDKVMLLGHRDDFAGDERMRVTVAFNRFGPNCNQRMPRVRNGYAHVANNFYDGWKEYAIGGSSHPTIRSEGNLFVASSSQHREATERLNMAAMDDGSWNWRSVHDGFDNGAFFRETGSGDALPVYKAQQWFPVAGAEAVRSLTEDAGALRCSDGASC